MFIDHKKSENLLVLASIFLISAGSVFFRWDMIFFLISIQVGAFLVLVLLQRIWKRNDIITSKICYLLGAQILGFLIGLFGLIVYLHHIHAVRAGLDFIFNIPTHVILPYRQLPLPTMHSLFDNDALFYVASSGMLFNMIVLVRPLLDAETVDKKFLILSLMLIPLAMFPYAFGRADWEHSLPLLYIITVVIIIAVSIGVVRKEYIIVVILLSFPIHNLFSLDTNRIVIPSSKNQIQSSIIEHNADCMEKIKVINNYKSIFVGRVSYKRFRTNSANLYLINPDIPPATAFISDEPGLQNSCYYGKKIVEQLKRANKPMLVFLETGEQPSEPNATSQMTSCMQIENYLKDEPFQQFGACTTNGTEFLIRVY